MSSSPSISDTILLYSNPGANPVDLKQAEAFLNQCEQSNFKQYLSELSNCIDVSNNNQNPQSTTTTKLALVLLGNGIKIENLVSLFIENNNNTNTANLPSPQELSSFSSSQIKNLASSVVMMNDNNRSMRGVASRCVSRCLLLCDDEVTAQFFQQLLSESSSSFSSTTTLVFNLLSEILGTAFSALKYLENNSQKFNGSQVFDLLSVKFDSSVKTVIIQTRQLLTNMLDSLLENYFSTNNNNNNNQPNNNDDDVSLLFAIKNALLTLTSTWSLSSFDESEDDDESNNNNFDPTQERRKSRHRVLAEFAEADTMKYVFPILQRIVDDDNNNNNNNNIRLIKSVCLQQLKNSALQILHEAVDNYSPQVILANIFSPMRNNNNPSSITANVEQVFAKELLGKSIEKLNNNQTNAAFPTPFHRLFVLEGAMKSIVLILRTIFSIMAQSGSGCNGPSQSSSASRFPWCCCLRHAFLTNDNLIQHCFCVLVTLSPFFEALSSSSSSENNNNTVNNEKAAKDISECFDLTPSEVLSPIVDLFEFLTNSSTKRKMGFGSGTTRKYGINRQEHNNNNNNNREERDSNLQQLMKQREQEEERKERRSGHNKEGGAADNSEDDDEEGHSLDFLARVFSPSSAPNNNTTSLIEEKVLTSTRRDFLALCVETQKLASVFVSQTMKVEAKHNIQKTSSNLKSWLKDQMSHGNNNDQHQHQQGQFSSVAGLAFALPLCFSLDSELDWISACETLLQYSSQQQQQQQNNNNNDNSNNSSLHQKCSSLALLISIYSPFIVKESNTKLIKKNPQMYSACLEKLCSESLLMNHFGSCIWESAKIFSSSASASSLSSSSSLEIMNLFSMRMILGSLLARAIDVFLSFTIQFSSSSSLNDRRIPQDVKQNLNAVAGKLVNFLLVMNDNNDINNNSSESPSPSVPILIHLLQSFENNIPLSINPLLCWNAIARSISLASNLLVSSNNNNNSNESSSLIPKIFNTLQTSVFSCWKNELGRADVAELAEEICTKFLPWILVSSSSSNNNNEQQQQQLFFSIYWLRDNILSELLQRHAEQQQQQGNSSLTSSSGDAAAAAADSSVTYLTPYAIRIVAETVLIRKGAYAIEAGRALFGHLCISCIVSSVARETAVVQASEMCLSNLLFAVVKEGSSLPLVSIPSFWCETFHRAFFSNNNNNTSSSSEMRIDQLAFATIMSILRPELLRKNNNNDLLFPLSNPNRQTNFFELNILKLTPLIVQYCDLLESLWEKNNNNNNTEMQQQQQQQNLASLFTLLSDVVENQIVTELCFLPAALGWLRVLCVAPDQLLMMMMSNNNNTSSESAADSSSSILKKLCKHSLWGFDSIDSLINITNSLTIRDVFSIILRLSSDRFLLGSTTDGSHHSPLQQLIRANANFVSIKAKKKLRKQLFGKNALNSAASASIPVFVLLDAVSTLMFAILIDYIEKEKEGVSPSATNEDNNDNDNDYDDDDDDEGEYEDYNDEGDDENGGANNNNNGEQDEDDDDEEEELVSLDNSLLSSKIQQSSFENEEIGSLQNAFENWKSGLPNQEGMQNPDLVLKLVPIGFQKVVMKAM